MSKATPMFLIALSKGTNFQRNLIHENVKANAKGWWHYLPDVWIAGGHDHEYWGQLLRPILAGSRSTVLVVGLPQEQSMRSFAIRGESTEKTKQWLWKTFLGRTMPDGMSEEAMEMSPAVDQSVLRPPTPEA
jgi:hypothetical protein